MAEGRVRVGIGACALSWLGGFAATTQVSVVYAVVAWVWAIPTALVIALFWLDHRAAGRAPGDGPDMVDLGLAPSLVRPSPGELAATVLVASTT